VARYVKAGSQAIEPAERWVKKGGVMRRITNRYIDRANVAQETWPLVPGAPTITGISFPYRNDRIEVDVAWTAPTSGATVTGYSLKLRFTYPDGSFASEQTHSISAGALTFTGTNGGPGYQTGAGQTMVATLTPLGSGGSGAPHVCSGLSVPNLPAPPAPTYTMSVDDAYANHTWSHVGGNRVSGVQVEMSVAGSGWYAYSYGAGSTGAQVQPWDPASINSASVSSRARTWGPGGTSAWVTVNGDIPSSPTYGNFRFLYGVLRTDLSGLSHQAHMYYYRGGGPWTFTGTTTNGVYSVVGSDGWARDDSTYCWIGGKGINTSNGWTGRWMQVGPALKLPMPYNISPTNSDTWRNGWMNDTNLVSQGTSSGGTRTGYWFYGTQFTDLMHQNRVGYYLNVTAAYVSIYRQSTGGRGQATSPHLYVHAWHVKPGGRPDLAGGIDTTALARGAAAWCPFNTGWARQLIDGTWRGLAMYDPNTWIDPTISTSLGYILGFGYATFWDGYRVGTVSIHHDG
jgi:hypothetical protein